MKLSLNMYSTCAEEYMPFYMYTCTDLAHKLIWTSYSNGHVYICVTTIDLSVACKRLQFNI